MQIRQVTQYLETLAPLSTQESYDNSGLIVGDPTQEVTGVLICLDSIEAIVDEAIEKSCNLIIAHHPIVFKGLKSFNGKNYIERTVMKAIKHDIAIYACHTNLDNYHLGVNYKIAEKLGLKNVRVLSPKGSMHKLTLFTPSAALAEVTTALQVDYVVASTDGLGSFTAVGAAVLSGEPKAAVRIERFVKDIHVRQLKQLLSALNTKVELSYVIDEVKGVEGHLGSGLVGDLPQESSELDALLAIKENMKAEVVRHTALFDKPVKRIALCGGSGSFLLSVAKRAGADIYMTADFKYHEFFDAENDIIIADIGHYESEQFTIELIGDLIKEKFGTFAVYYTELNTNPVNYL